MSDFMKKFKKQFGEDSVFSFADPNSDPITPIPFGVPSLDYVTNINGLPSGRLVELYGGESSGKTTLCLMLLKTAQTLQRDKTSRFFGRRGAFVDAEFSASRDHMVSIGIDLNDEDGLMLVEPESGETAFDMLESMCASEEFSVIIVDSVAALSPKAEGENDNTYNPVGLQARMMSKGLRKLKGIAKRSNTLVVFINQTRTNAGQMFGNPETTPGGQSLKFYASIRGRVSRKIIQSKQGPIGQEITVEFIKNKVGAPYGKTTFNYMYDSGVDIYTDIAEMADRLEIFNKAGSWYYLGESTKNPMELSNGLKVKFNGKADLAFAFRMNQELFFMVNNHVQEALKPKTILDAAPENEEEEPSEEATLL
ncbi:DNA recombination/repair protein RecA [bacterium]|nr:DNA recombination/repair protein RecA [bacterium]